MCIRVIVHVFHSILSSLRQDPCLPQPDHPPMHDFIENVIKGLRHIPVGIVSPHLAKITDVAHVVPFTGLLHIFPVHDFAGPVLDVAKRLKDGAGIVTTTATIVDLRNPWGPDELLGESGDVVGVDVISHLLALVPVDSYLSHPLGDIVAFSTVHRKYNGRKEHTMSPSKRYAKKQAKARQRRRLQAHERLERDRRQAQRARRPCTKPWRTWACQQTWWWRSKAAYGANRSSWAKSSG